MKTGDILLVPFPFTDLSSRKIRPALVITERASDVILLFITSKLSWIDENDLYIEADSENGLKYNSVIKTGKLLTLDRNLINGKLGNINENQMKIIKRNLIKVLNLS